MLGVDEVLGGRKLQYNIGLIGLIRLIWLIRLIRLIGLIRLKQSKANSFLLGK